MNKSLRNSRRSGFTLVEMMVAIAILLTMLTIILVPLRLGLDSYALGKSRSETQGSLGVTIASIEKDLRRAVIVFPNSQLKGVIDSGPYYTSNTAPAPNEYNPTRESACLGNAPNIHRISNPSRIDMILARHDNSGNLVSPVEAGETLVSYYPRRLDVTKPYDPIDNPIALYRAEIPFRTINVDGSQTFVMEGSDKNADISNARHPLDCSADSSQKNRQSMWLAHNYWGEANLEGLTHQSVTGDDRGSHSLAMPRGLGLVVTNGGCTKEPCEPSILGLIPESTFSTADTNGDGKIDRVNISLTFTSFDAQGSNRLRNDQPVGQQQRASRTIDLPNIQ
jgi:prepilin-type N-terminal cleavage/methylation domain-containing protein